MPRSSQALLLLTAVICAGCNPPPETVYVDLDEVLRQEKIPAPRQVVVPKPPATRPALNAEVLGAPAVNLEDPSNRPRRTVQEMFDAEQAKALSALEQRLRRLYHGQVQEFSLLEAKTAAKEEQHAYDQANAQIRPLFDKWAEERAAKYAQLALIAGFPIPDTPPPTPERSRSAQFKKRAEDATKLRDELKVIDANFAAERDKILSSVQTKVKVDQAAIKARIDTYAAQLDRKAESEAKAQIREAVSKLRFQLADPTPINLPAMPPTHVSIPAERPLEAPPGVPSGGILEGTADRRRLLSHELRIWLALNRYELSGTPRGRRNATQEFQTWRQQHGAGR